MDFQEKMCEEYATAPAFSNLASNMSYRDFGAKVTALAAYLQSLPGVEQGDRVALMMPNLFQYPVALFAVLKAGLIVVNVNPLYTSRELGGVLKDSEAKVLIIIENFARPLRESRRKLRSSM